MQKYCFLVLTFLFGFSTFLHAQISLLINSCITTANHFPVDAFLSFGQDVVRNGQQFTFGAQCCIFCGGAGGGDLGDMETQNQ